MTREARTSFKMMSFIHETLYGLFRDPNKALQPAGLEAGQRVLEVGCGPGFFTIPASRIVGEGGSVVAIDFNPLAVEHVQAKIDESGEANVEVLVASAAETGLPAQAFDLAFLFGLARPIGDMQAIWTEVHRLLTPEGTVAIEGRLRPPGELFQPMVRNGRISRFRKTG